MIYFFLEWTTILTSGQMVVKLFCSAAGHKQIAWTPVWALFPALKDIAYDKINSKDKSKIWSRTWLLLWTYSRALTLADAQCPTFNTICVPVYSCNNPITWQQCSIMNKSRNRAGIWRHEWFSKIKWEKHKLNNRTTFRGCDIISEWWSPKNVSSGQLKIKTHLGLCHSSPSYNTELMFHITEFLSTWQWGQWTLVTSPVPRLWNKLNKKWNSTHMFYHLLTHKV